MLVISRVEMYALRAWKLISSNVLGIGQVYRCGVQQTVPLKHAILLSMVFFLRKWCSFEEFFPSLYCTRRDYQ